MRRPAKILIAGTFAAILPCGAATSQTLSGPVLNDQIQLGDVFSQQTLNVVEVTDQTVGTATATGNSFDGTVDRGDLDVRSNQTLQANVGAQTTLNVEVNSGASTVLTTAATGNTGDAGVFAGTLRGVFTQATGPTQITSNSHTEAPNAQAGDISSASQAIGNSQGVGVSYGAAGVRITQSNQAQVVSDGGGNVGYVSGSANFAASTAANNATIAGQGSAQRVVASQDNGTDLVQASQFTAFGNAYLANTQATATGNNLSAGNAGGLLDVTSDQQNTAYLRAEAVSSAYEYGAGTANAYGVGNSLLAGNQGDETIVDNTQLNDGGGIEAVASYSGHDGYDAASSATAIGNAATGYACSDCQSTITATNRQTNSAEVGASSTLTLTGTARSAVSAANAVGNTASYYVTRPSYGN